MANEKAIQKHEPQRVEAERMRNRWSYAPHVDIAEQPDRFVVVADMPGVGPDDLDISYERGTLTIHGRVTPRQAEQTTEYVAREYGVGDFYRSFQLGEGIDADRIEAELRDGVLTLELPKSEGWTRRKIPVKTG